MTRLLDALTEELPVGEELRAHLAEVVTLAVTRRRAAQYAETVAEAAALAAALVPDIGAAEERAEVAVLYHALCHLHHEFVALAGR